MNREASQEVRESQSSHQSQIPLKPIKKVNSHVSIRSNHSEDTTISENKRKNSSVDLERSDDDDFLIGCLDLMFEDCQLSNESFDFKDIAEADLKPTKLKKKLKKFKELHNSEQQPKQLSLEYHTRENQNHLTSFELDEKSN